MFAFINPIVLKVGFELGLELRFEVRLGLGYYGGLELGLQC